MKFLKYLKMVQKFVLDFLFGADSENIYSERHRKFIAYRRYRFVPRLRAKPQVQKH